ncbi:MAG: winged helix-turn-helix transcriptional regulator [Deltaproteobacteria bacterium]|nr:winged helix-turn-helix transcriptional regulator [Deltaproteobacteria bacterium]
METEPKAQDPQLEAEVHARPLFCPVARGLDLMGERWTLVLVRHLLGGPRGFQELRNRSGIGPRVLSTRLRQLTERGFVEPVRVGTRSLYGLTPFGRTLEPIVREIALWWVRNRMRESGPYSETTAASVVEALPFMLREERARGVHISYEIRLTGKGGGVWTITIDDGSCSVEEGFADHADVRYTADARDWTSLALGFTDDRKAYEQGRLIKDGVGGSMAWYFYQPANPRRHNGGNAP